jgi:hypothetical protein
MSGFVKLDTGILNSSLWIERDLRSLFVTALVMAEPFEVTESMPQLNVRSLESTGWTVPAGWYGFVEASGTGIVRRDGMTDIDAGLTVLETLCSPDPDSRSQDFEGRRLARVDGGYIVLNYFKFRERDYRRKNPSAATDSYVYYAQDGDLIKIGLSKNPWARMSDLRLSRPKIALLAAERGNGDLEWQRHDQFKGDRIGGEWFKFSDSLRTHIESLKGVVGEPNAVATVIDTVATVAPTMDESPTVVAPVATKEGIGQRSEAYAENIKKPTTTDLSDGLFVELQEPQQQPRRSQDVTQVLWRYKELHPRRKVEGPKPRAIVARALKSGRTVEELIEAIEGNAADPWHKANTKHELSYVLRDDEHIDRAIALKHAPPPPSGSGRSGKNGRREYDYSKTTNSPEEVKWAK